MRAPGQALPSLTTILVMLIGLAGAGSPALAQSSRGPTFHDIHVVGRVPHAEDAFCQGLEFDAGGALYEGTGLYGQSALRKVDPATGKVLKEVLLDPSLFGEGITLWDGKIYQLTWQNRQAIVYDQESFQEVTRFRYTGEGWGLTHDDKHLIMSDGTSTLRFLDPKTFQVVKRLRVVDRGRPIDQLNELEFIQGEIYANIWNSPYIARISPETGQVVGWINLTGLEPRQRSGSNSVLNGIAKDPKTNKLYVTGKNWSEMFEIQLVPRTR